MNRIAFLIAAFLLCCPFAADSSYVTNLPEYMMLTVTSTTIPSNGAEIDFDTIDEGNYPSGDVGSSGIITLHGGHSYQLIASVSCTGSSGGYISYRWYVTGGSALGSLALSGAPEYSSNNISTKQASAFYRPSSDTQVEVQVEGSSNRSAIDASRTFAIVEEVVY